MSVKQVFNTSAELDYPTVLPTLDLDFANSKTLDPRITFTRSSGGSYVGADGLIKYAGVNEPRFDHDPVTGESLGFLVEESRTNFALDSNDYSISINIINASITTNVITAPDGTLTADMITASAGNAQHGPSKFSTGLPINSVCSLSVFVKAGTHNFCRVDSASVTNWSTNAGVTVNLTNGSIISGSGTVEPYPNGWYRITTYPTSNSTAGVSRGMWVWVAGSNGSSIYDAVGTETIHVWGAQLEAGAFPTSYIPTEASTRTRAADDASITGKNFSEWYRQDEGSFYSQFKTELNITNNIWSINNYPNTTFGTLQNYFRLLTLSNTIHTQYNVAGTNLYPQFSLANNNSQKVTQSYNINSSPIISALNGTIGTGSGNIYATSPGFNQLEFGKNTDARTTIGQYTISRLTYFPKRLPNSQLQTLTS